MPRFSVVLLGPMLWTTYDQAGGTVQASVHVKGPTPGDVVMVTDEVVVAALLKGSVSVRDAYDLGLIRYYGSDADIARLAQILDDLTPLPAESAPAPFSVKGKVLKVAAEAPRAYGSGQALHPIQCERE